MQFIKKNNVEWKTVKYLKEPLGAAPQHATWKYKMILPEPLASWDVFDYWEKERISSMEKHLKKGDILFDVGTESGWCNLIYAEIVGPENMVLIEPTQEFWPNIKETWKKNFDIDPLSCVPVLFSNKNKGDFKEQSFIKGFPECSNNDLIDRNKYQYIHDNQENIPEITLDNYVQHSKITPDALTMDVEGAELLILRGAKNTLKKHKPKLFISIHPDLGERDYGITKEDTLGFLKELGYTGEYLATDHEEHWYFS